MKLALVLIVIMLAGVVFNVYLAEQQCIKNSGVFSIVDRCSIAD